jgi:hypothetical protein
MENNGLSPTDLFHAVPDERTLEEIHNARSWKEPKVCEVFSSGSSSMACRGARLVYTTVSLTGGGFE